ncbi:MAG: MerR family transcriptional regulator [Kofleriaceae bacterium]
MTEQWTLAELVNEVGARIAALPAPKNGQVRAVPDDRTIRYYATLGLLDRPDTMRGRTAIYGRKHLAQVVAIKRMQLLGRSLAEIQQLWPTMDDPTLARMAGVALPITVGQPAARKEFWKREPRREAVADPQPAAVPSAPVELRIELAANLTLVLAVVDEHVSISPADVRAIRAAAAPLIAELAQRSLTTHAGGEP